ncbi:MAG: hypothetical protein KAI29_15055 [Cyclobacteriaceae bacterium]|nr:hypothetical protein [Cyclobacteriaceae bacterium]
MKNLGTFLSIISIVVGITACEKSPEDIFDMSAIPGQYEGYTEVLAPPDSSGNFSGGIGVLRIIPENFDAKYINSIQKVKENQYTLTFGTIDTILPNKITFKISEFEEHSYDQIDAYIKVLENDLWQLSNIFNWGMGNGIHNQFRYTDHEWNRTMQFIFVLKSKIRDDITIVCHGYRHHF